mmetsp:Transcript_1008/g.1958  ORF Transcript_1008/g.1958 Transcript_1008/m.1958 type:complete len:225 (+) Transcript_1008:654-1328(+)
MLTKCIDLETDRAAVRACDRLAFQVDRHNRVRPALGVIHQHVDLLLRQNDRQDAILEAVVVKNIRERRRDHAADAEVQQRPGRMFTRGSATEVVASHKDLRVAIGRLVQDEIGDLVAVIVIAHLVKQVHPKARTLDRLQELLGNDHVGIDVDQGHRRGNAGQFGEFVHGEHLSLSRSQTLKPLSLIYWSRKQPSGGGRFHDRVAQTTEPPSKTSQWAEGFARGI